MIYHLIKRLAIYKNKQEFYLIGCIALWGASLHFNKEKGEFKKSYAYSYIMSQMKTKLTNERMQQEKDRRLEAEPTQEETSRDDFTYLLSDSVIDSVSSLLTSNQSKWLKVYCLYGILIGSFL